MNWKWVSQFLVILLMLDAAWVAWGLYQQRVMWVWIVMYWVLLTLKNGADYISVLKEKKIAEAGGENG